MISRISGILHNVDELVVTVEIGPIWYEAMVPTSVAQRLPRPGEKIILHTYAYIDGGGMGGAMQQRLIGFLDKVERDFFLLLTSVSGLGMRKGARAMAIPVSRFAAAIEHGDERALRNLPEIGPKTAKKIIAELQGKMGKFALLRDSRPAVVRHAAPVAATPAAAETAPAAASESAPMAGSVAAVEPTVNYADQTTYELIEEARYVLTSLLHYNDREAQQMIDRALTATPNPSNSDELIQTIFRQTGG